MYNIEVDNENIRNFRDGGYVVRLGSGSVPAESGYFVTEAHCYRSYKRKGKL